MGIWLEIPPGNRLAGMIMHLTHIMHNVDIGGTVTGQKNVNSSSSYSPGLVVVPGLVSVDQSFGVAAWCVARVHGNAIGSSQIAPVPTARRRQSRKDRNPSKRS
jgi:hypothetical protein